MNANLYVKFDLTEEDRRRVVDAANLMDEIMKEICKCTGEYNGGLHQAKAELMSILKGEVI